MTDISFFPNNINTSSLERLLELKNFTTANHQRQNALIFCQSLPANFWRKCMETSLENLYLYLHGMLQPAWEASKGVGEEREEGREGGWGSREDLLFPFRFSLPSPPPTFPSFLRPPPRSGLLVYTGAQEPITRIVQLPCAHVTAFWKTSLFLERLWCKFWISLNSTNQSGKPTDLKMIFFFAF